MHAGAFRVKRFGHLIGNIRANSKHFRESSSVQSSDSQSKSVESSGSQQSPLPPVTGKQSWSQAEFRKVTKPRNEPFAKNLFLGRFDKKILVYPEIDNDEELVELNQMVQPLEKFFREIVDSKAIDINAKIPEETLQQLKDLGLFGQQIPVEYGGLGLDATKFARIAEVTALDGAVAVTLAAHQSIGLKGLLLFGTEEQKRKYLPKLASGEHVAAFALTEPSSGSDAASVQTKATLSEDGSTYYLNGNKIFITNGGIADVFTVFAKTEATDKHGEKHGKVTAFFVERAFGGITNGKPEDKLGIRGSNTCEVFFENTPVPAENVIGEVGGGFKVAMNILNSGRFSMGSSGAGILKLIIEQTVEHAITRSQFGQKLTDFGLIQSKFANMAMITYAMESMAYMTAGIIDDYEDPDMSIEAAMVKVFSSEAVWYCVSEALQILGGMGYMKDQPFERYVRDARIMMIFEGTNEILRLLIALSGIQHAGKELKETVKKLKQPFNNPGMMFKVIVKGIRGKLANPPLSLELDANVHPSLKKPAQLLEKNVLRFQICVEKLLVDFGNKIVNEQMALEKVSNIAIDLYAMTACISRASRSYCIGLRNADHEMLLTKLFCDEANDRIEHNLELLCNADRFDMYKEVAETIFQNKGYAAEHPLTKNW